MTPGNETKEMFPFIPLILSKVNSYEDSVTGKFKSPFLNFRAVCFQFLSFLAKHRGLFFNMNNAFFWASTMIHQHKWVVHGVLQDKEEKPGLLFKHVWLNIYINNSYNNLFVNSVVNPAIHNNFHFQLKVKTTPGELYTRTSDNLKNFQTLIKESLASCKNQISVVWDLLLSWTKNAPSKGIKLYLWIDNNCFYYNSMVWFLIWFSFVLFWFG